VILNGQSGFFKASDEDPASLDGPIPFGEAHEARLDSALADPDPVGLRRDALGGWRDQSRSLQRLTQHFKKSAVKWRRICV
jgi:hypothetical protein